MKIIKIPQIQINSRLILAFLFSSSFFALFLAYISQYVFGLQPCALCHYQRIPFFLVIIVTLLSFFIKEEKWQKIIIKIALAILIFNVFLAFYHVGVEQKIFIFDKCASLIPNLDNLEALKKELLRAKSIRCDEPQFILFGISMAGWNVIYCASVVVFAIFALKKIK